MPKVPPEAMDPAASDRAYPRSSIWGKAIRAMVAAVATEDGFFIEPGADATADVVGAAVFDARAAGGWWRSWGRWGWERMKAGEIALVGRDSYCWGGS